MTTKIRHIFCVFLINKVFIILPALYAVLQRPTLTHGKSVGHFLLVDNLVRWDARWYERIAAHGYSYDSTAFFPLYPASMHVLSKATGLGISASGILISNILFIAMLWFSYDLFRLDYDERDTRKILWLMAVFPTSFYFTAVYTESMFGLFTVLALYAIRRRIWWGAGLSGLFASATRNTGVLLAAPYVLEYFDLVRFKDLRQLLPKLKRRWGALFWLCLIPGGLLLYMAYLWRRFGDPVAFSHAERIWGRSFHNPFSTMHIGLRYYFRYITHPDWKWHCFGYMLTNSLWVVVMILLIIFAARRLRLSYWLFMVLAFLIPLADPVFSRHDYFMSISRYTLVIIPVYITLFHLLRRSRWLYGLFVFLSAVFMMDLVYLWTMNAGFIA